MSEKKQRAVPAEASAGTKRLALISFVAFALVFIIAVTCILVLPFDKNTLYGANTSTNMKGGGLVAANKTATCYADAGGIYRIGSTSPLAEGKCEYISLLEDKLYYVKDGALYESSAIIKSEKKLLDNVVRADVVGNWIFYLDKDSVLHKMRRSTENQTKLFKVYGDYTIIGTSIYYKDENGKISRAPSDGSKSELFFDETVDRFSIESSLILFLKDGEFCTATVNAEGRTTQKWAAADDYTFVDNLIAISGATGLRVVDLAYEEKDTSSDTSDISGDASEETSSVPSVVSAVSVGTPSSDEGYEAPEDGTTAGTGQITTIRTGVFTSLHSDGSFFYYLNQDGVRCRIKPDNTEFAMLTAGEAHTK